MSVSLRHVATQLLLDDIAMLRKAGVMVNKAVGSDHLDELSRRCRHCYPHSVDHSIADGKCLFDTTHFEAILL